MESDAPGRRTTHATWTATPRATSDPNSIAATTIHEPTDDRHPLGRDGRHERPVRPGDGNRSIALPSHSAPWYATIPWTPPPRQTTGTSERYRLSGASRCVLVTGACGGLPRFRFGAYLSRTLRELFGKLPVAWTDDLMRRFC